ncbi:MAG: hypothetical protein COA86_18750 [Kangiella sp.]|nr:MAG: hypothetical protein COA86_18750 [Kangiella sp.]
MTKEQILLCEKYSTEYYGIDFDQKVGIALQTLESEPLHALRHVDEKGTSGWFIWGGEFKDDSEFFQSLCGVHLHKYCPHILKYLALKPGYRIMIDRKGFEDIWFDNELIS